MAVFAMGKIVARKETGDLFFDFRYLGKRCREQTTLADRQANRKELQKLLERIEAEITLGTFDYNSGPIPERATRKTLSPSGNTRIARAASVALGRPCPPKARRRSSKLVFLGSS